MHSTFDRSLRLTYKALYLSGISIFPEDTKLTRAICGWVFLINFLWLHTDVLGELYWLVEGVQLGKSFTELSLTAPCTCICFLASVKVIPLYYYRRLFRKVIAALKEIHPQENNGDSTNIFKINNGNTKFKSINEVKFETTEKLYNYKPKYNAMVKNDEDTIEKSAKITKEVELEVLTHANKVLNTVVKFQVISFTAVIIFFLATPVTAMGYEYHTKKQTDLKLPFLIKYFFDPFTVTRYPLMYLHQGYSTVMVCFNIFAADTFIYAFCTFMQMHFRILSHHYSNVVCESSEDTWNRLVHLIKRHQKLIKLVDKMEIIYTKSTLFNIVVSSVLICLCGFNVTFNDDMGALFKFLSFLVMNVSQISLLCLFGDMLMFSSTKLSDAIYNSRWYDADERTKRSLLFILTRAQRPCKLTACNFADLNLKAFTTILSRSWSLFAVLKTTYN